MRWQYGYASLVLCSVFVVLTFGVLESDVDRYLDRCLRSKYHKEKPGKEGSYFHCSPWENHACCTANTTRNIQVDGTVSMYNMKWDQCNQTMSPKCRRFFEMDTCFYECSPNLAPWIVVDKYSKKTRRERVVQIPLCASACDEWFDACKDDLTCSNNWGNYSTWNWKTGMCKMECKTFKEYFGGPEKFCNKIFNHSFSYSRGTPGKDCFILWPNSTLISANIRVARKAAKKAMEVNSKAASFAITSFVVIFVSFAVLLIVSV